MRSLVVVGVFLIISSMAVFAAPIAEDDFGTLGDTSTLAEPQVVDDLIENRMNRS